MNQRNTMIHSEFEEARGRVEAFLEALVGGDHAVIDLPENLNEAMNYSLLAGGKRLRPVVVLLCCGACGGDREKALAPAAALEMIHCFSLIHDDLPAMDDDDLRRGQATNHKKFGEAMAILAGDGLATLPYLVIGRSELLSEIQKARMMEELAEGTMRMIAGQVYDTMGGFENGLSPEECLEITHRNKTGALIRCGCRLGVIAAMDDGNQDAVEGMMEALTKYGEAIGLMFQMVDDVLDETQTTEHLGKGSGKDAEAGKLTYPVVYGLERSRELIDEMAGRANGALDGLGTGEAVGALRELVSYLVTRTK